ncbi:glycosyltransferase [Rhodococcus sp. NPDC057014]|uniref:glycosyltransferase n=1 Tax=Rhodococcus sp. NPDC057014 TaxID=3346000 RepID=UPI0036328CD8
MIGYYIHHHGQGHRARAASICSALATAVTALSSAPLPPSPAKCFADAIRLPRDDRGGPPVDPTAHETLHWAPLLDRGLQSRMSRIATWIESTRPSLMVVDVSVEAAVFVRLLGVPVVVMAMPGDRTDSAHRLGYQLAEHIISAWPQEIYDPTWLQEFAHKTTFVGGISRFDGRACADPPPSGRPQVLVLSGTGGSSLTMDDIRRCAQQHRGYRWQALGVPGAPWTDDPWPQLSSADVVISHAGQNAVADIATARRPAIIIAQERPFDEQQAIAAALAAHGLAVSVPQWPPVTAWPHLIETALALGGGRWPRWQTAGAAARAAAVIDTLAKQSESSR